MTQPERWQIRPECEGWVMQDTCTGVADVIATYLYGREDGPAQITAAHCNACHAAIQTNTVGSDGDTRLFFHHTEVWYTFEESS